jgi:predicted phosphodiesterase
VIGLLYDVHGNLRALEAVLSDARRQGVTRWILGGDYALFGPEPEATVALLRSLEPAIWIRGNVDRWTAEPDSLPADAFPLPAIAACREVLDPALVDELGALPEEALHDGTRYVHASPVSDVRSFLPQPAEDEPELLEGVQEPRLVFGHTHLPFRRFSMAGGIELVNPGSVGIPLDGDRRAAYALVHPDRRVEHRRVPYDHAASAARVRERWPGAEWAETIARRIEHARVDG